MMVSKTLNSFLKVAAVLSVVSCSADGPSIPDPVSVTVTVAGCAGTRATGIADGGTQEDAINDVQVILFDGSGAADGYGNVLQDGTVRVATRAGRHEVWALTNFPSIASVTTKDQLLAMTTSLSDQSFGDMVHVGKMTAQIAPGWTGTVELKHLLTRVTVSKITNALAPEVLSSQEFRILDIYLTNAPATVNLGMTEAPSVWYNKMGLRNEMDAFLHDAIPAASQVVPLNGSYGTRHLLYTLPNIQEEDSRSDVWCARHTRLVIKASIGGTVYYYPITLPVTASNESYDVREVVVSRMGVLDEETELPFTAFVFSTDLTAMTEEESGRGFRSLGVQIFFGDIDLGPWTSENGSVFIYSEDGTLWDLYFKKGSLADWIAQNGTLIIQDGSETPWDYYMKTAELNGYDPENNTIGLTYTGEPEP